MTGRVLGRVVGGSTQGLKVRLEEGVSVEEMAVGRYVTVEGEKRRFFGLITDVELASLDPGLDSLEASDPFIARVLSGTGTYGLLQVLPVLTVEVAGLPPGPAKTIPAPFSLVREATEADVSLVFGAEDPKHFHIGNPLDLEAKVCLDLDKFVQRSNGVFGKSGTGKTFLTRLLLYGIIQRGQAVTLVFDMHSEYGWEGEKEEGGTVKGLKQFFQNKVTVFTLDPESSRRRKVPTDFAVQIGYDEIEPEDISLLRETLRLTELAAQVPYRLARLLGPAWLQAFIQSTPQQVQDLAQDLGENEATLASLHRRLQPFQRLPFLVPQSPAKVLDQILAYLEKGVSVVLEFGRYNDILPYMLVANLLTRRLHDHYVKKTERARGEGASHPRPLVITVEEAHRFLSPELSGHTTFGQIAREMRKFYVTLLVIDQRPSGIDEEVMSQLGTKITCLLDNERDIDSVLAGTPGKNELKRVLSRLESKQQALIFGHALPMPVAVQVREYSSLYRETAQLRKRAEQDKKDIWEE